MAFSEKRCRSILKSFENLPQGDRPLKRIPQLFFDVSFTRTQGSNVGIIRTVNRLFKELRSVAPTHEMLCIPVVFHTGGFRILRDTQEGRDGGAVLVNKGALRSIVLKLIPGKVFQFISAYCPLALRHLGWRILSRQGFNGLAKGFDAVNFAPGDVVFLSDASWNYRVWSAARLARQQGAKVVTVVYDLIPLRQPEFCPPIHTMVFGRWLTALMPQSDGILCISRAVEEDLRHYAKEVNAKLPLTSNFRLGCDLVPKMTDENEVRKAISEFFTDASCFTAIGSFEPRKNYGFLLRAFEALWARHVDVRLLIIGRRDSQCRELLDRIERHPERGRRLLAVFDGTDEEVAFGYRSSLALIFPSLSEGFGLPLVEARAYGCRVIASDLPVFVELADDGVSIFPRNSQEALENLVLSHLEQNTREIAAAVPFTWTDSAHSCMNFIKKV